MKGEKLRRVEGPIRPYVPPKLSSEEVPPDLMLILSLVCGVLGFMMKVLFFLWLLLCVRLILSFSFLVTDCPCSPDEAGVVGCRLLLRVLLYVRSLVRD